MHANDAERLSRFGIRHLCVYSFDQQVWSQTETWHNRVREIIESCGSNWAMINVFSAWRTRWWSKLTWLVQFWRLCPRMDAYTWTPTRRWLAITQSQLKKNGSRVRKRVCLAATKKVMLSYEYLSWRMHLIIVHSNIRPSVPPFTFQQFCCNTPFSFLFSLWHILEKFPEARELNRRASSSQSTDRKPSLRIPVCPHMQGTTRAFTTPFSLLHFFSFD